MFLTFMCERLKLKNMSDDNLRHNKHMVISVRKCVPLRNIYLSLKRTKL